MKQGQEWIITGYIQPNSLREVAPINDDYFAIRGFIQFESSGRNITRMFFAENELAEQIDSLDLSELVRLTGEHNYMRTLAGKDSKMQVRKVESGI